MEKITKEQIIDKVRAKVYVRDILSIKASDITIDICWSIISQLQEENEQERKNTEMVRGLYEGSCKNYSLLRDKYSELEKENEELRKGKDVAQYRMLKHGYNLMERRITEVQEENESLKKQVKKLELEKELKKLHTIYVESHKYERNKERIAEIEQQLKELEG